MTTVTCLTSSDIVTRAVGLRHPATHLHHWRLPPYPHPACRHEWWLRLVCLRHYGSCPSTVAAGDGARLSLSGDMADLAISRKGREKAIGKVKHQGSRLGGRITSTTNSCPEFNRKQGRKFIQCKLKLYIFGGLGEK